MSKLISFNNVVFWLAGAEINSDRLATRVYSEMFDASDEAIDPLVTETLIDSALAKSFLAKGTLAHSRPFWHGVL
jgi:hypothetical protein